MGEAVGNSATASRHLLNITDNQHACGELNYFERYLEIPSHPKLELGVNEKVDETNAEVYQGVVAMMKKSPPEERFQYIATFDAFEKMRLAFGLRTNVSRWQPSGNFTVPEP